MSTEGEATSQEFYGPQYARVDSELAVAIRREAFGEDDLGQEGWRCQRRRKGQPLGRRHFGPVALVEGGRERSAPSWRRSERAAAGAVRLMGLRRADWPRGDRGRAHQARQRGLGGLWPWVAPPLRLCGGQQIA